LLRAVAFIVVMLVGTGAALFNRFAALLMYIWFALFRPQEWVWTDISGLRLSLVLGGLLVIPSLASGILPNLTHPLSVGAVLFLLTGLIAQLGAVRPDLGWYWLDFMGRLVLVCLLATTLVNTKRRFFLTIAVIAGSLGYHTAKAGLASLLVGGVQFSDGLAGAFLDNNGYAMAAVMVMPFLLATAQNLPRASSLSKLIRIGLYVSVPLTAFTVISTFSRAGFLALIASVLIFVLLQRRRALALLVITAALAIAAPFIPIPKGYFNRIETIRTYEQIDEDSAMSRWHFWHVAANMAKAHPLGVGMWNFESNYDRYDFLDGRYGRARSVHSSHFQVLAEEGYPGAVVWLALFAFAFRTAFKVRARSRAPTLDPADQRFLFTMSNALIVSMGGFFVGGAFVAAALNDLTWLTFALVAAVDRLSLSMVADKPEAVVVQPRPAVA
jgi:putative inorganic carbon (hco3(-)) transporter